VNRGRHSLKVAEGLAILPERRNFEVVTLFWGGHLLQEA
jgi:hypothetical protein